MNAAMTMVPSMLKTNGCNVCVSSNHYILSSLALGFGIA
jgi:hypothetical protein